MRRLGGWRCLVSAHVVTNAGAKRQREERLRGEAGESRQRGEAGIWEEEIEWEGKGDGEWTRWSLKRGWEERGRRGEGGARAAETSEGRVAIDARGNRPSVVPSPPRLPASRTQLSDRSQDDRDGIPLPRNAQHRGGIAGRSTYSSAHSTRAIQSRAPLRRRAVPRVGG